MKTKRLNLASFTFQKNFHEGVEELEFTFIGPKKESSHVNDVDLSNPIFFKRTPDEWKKFWNIYDVENEAEAKEVLHFFSELKLAYIFASYRGELHFDIRVVSGKKDALEEYVGIVIQKKKYHFKNNADTELSEGRVYHDDDWYSLNGLFNLTNQLQIKNLFDSNFWVVQFEKSRNKERDKS